MTHEAENDFAYNILVPDFLLFAIAMTGVFGLLIAVF